MRFIILGNARTGSNLLVNLLSNYPDVKVFGELLNLNSLKESALIKALSDPVQYLETYFDSVNHSVVDRVGFKIFYYHATRENLLPNNFPDKNIAYAPAVLRNRIQHLHDFVKDNYNFDELGTRIEKVWEYLKSDTNLKVIHLKRKNKLATFLSLRRAFMTDQWGRPKGIKAKVRKALKNIPRKIAFSGDPQSLQKPLQAIHLSYNDCLEAFQKYTDWEKYYSEFFADHATVDVFYENLKTDSEAEMEKVHSLLDLTGRVRLKTSLGKQRSKPLSESIANFQKLKLQFTGSPWEEFFEE